MVGGDVLGTEALGVPRLALKDAVAARLEALDLEYVNVTAAAEGPAAASEWRGGRHACKATQPRGLGEASEVVAAG